MQFEEFDKKIKDAADHHHPAYNEKAWGKMAGLLDEHMPVKEDRRRRIIFFILIPVILAGGTWLMTGQFKSSGKHSPADKQDKVLAPVTPGEATVVAEPNNNNPSPGIADRSQVAITQPPGEKNGTTNNSTTVNIPVVSKGIDPFIGNTLQAFEVRVTSPSVRKKIGKPGAEPVNPLPNGLPGNNDNRTKYSDKEVPVQSSVAVQPPATTNTPAPQPQKQATGDEKKNETAATEPIVREKKKESRKRNNSPFFSFSAGPDISSVGTDRVGKTKLLTGIGLGYTFNNRLTVRTGFYTARKIYSAAKDDYKPAVRPPNYYYLDKIDANCQVYEIPLNLAYHFGRTGKHNFFAGAGLSSYLMKTEDYVYVYKYPGNPPVIYTHDYSYKNENNHYFSVLGISAGYQRNLGKTFSIMAEPYVKLPLSGVGHGNVKLNSAGVVFSVNVKPFQHKGKDIKKLPAKTE